MRVSSLAACCAIIAAACSDAGTPTRSVDTEEPVATIELAPASPAVVVGASTQLQATLKDAAGNVLTGRSIAWASSNEQIATVSSSGVLTGVAVGSASIGASSEGVSRAVTAAVTPVPVGSVSLDVGSFTLTVGESRQLTATIRDADGNVLSGRSIEWTSSNSSVATVSSSGLVTAVGSGGTTITAASEGKSSSATVTVSAPPPTLTAVELTPSSVSLQTGATQQFSATGRMSDGSTQSVSVSYAATGGTVTSAGLYTAGNTTGTFRVIAKQSGGTLVDTSSVMITALPPVPVATVTVSPATASIIAGNTTQLTATVRDGNGNVLSGRSITWTSGSTSIATVDGNGLVSGASAGSATITATSEGKSGSATVTVTVPPPTLSAIELTPASVSLLTGATQQFSAIGRMSDGSTAPVTIAWSATGGTVSSTGLYTAGSTAGTYRVIARQSGGTLADTASVSITTPTPAPVASVGVSPASTSIPVGSTAQLTATLEDADGNVLAGRSIAWVSSNPGVASVNGSGLVTGVAVGSANITAISESKSGSATVTVTPLPPTLTAVEVTPVSVSLLTGATQQFSAIGRMSDGSTQAVSVTWSATGGTIASSGLYTAGSTTGTYRVIARQSGGTLADTASVTVTAPSTAVTGLDFLGNADGRSTLFAWNLSRTGVAPMAKFPATYIWRAYPRSGQLGYWSSLFHASWQGPNTFDVKYFYYGTHPYPWEPVAWEISAGSNDQPEDPSQRVPVVFNRWYTQVVTVDANAKITFYYDWDAGQSFSYQDVDRPQPDPALIVGDAPWNPGHEIYYGILRGFQYYDALLTPAQIAQEVASPGAVRRPWYLNLNPTPDDITDKSGSGHDPQWMTSNRPRLWTQP